MQYQHTQRAPIHWILFATGTLMFIAAWFAREAGAVPLAVVAAAVVLFLFALSFRSLTVQDEGDSLAMRYGPLPLFHKAIRYTKITEVEPGRSAVIDGWGIHWIPGRGWTYNLWGFDCVVVHLNGRRCRIGTDDVENLVAFLRSRIAS